MHGKTRDSAEFKLPGEVSSAPAGRACAACGAPARREAARFCATCGRRLAEDYFPTDSLRASYRFDARDTRQATREASPGEASRRRVRVPTTHARVKREVMPLRNTNGASTTALAFVTYSLVPYIGILFCPGALLLGGVGLLRARRSPHMGGRRASAMSITFGVVILCAQLLLWWILYKIPEWSRQAMIF